MTYKIPKLQVRRRTQEFAILHSKLISLADLIGQKIINQEGQQLGTVVDLVFRWDTGEPYPPLSGIIARVSRRQVWIPADHVTHVTPTQIELGSARLDLREFKPREGEVRLAKEVLDHQLIDLDGARVVRASDLYVALAAEHVRLVGVDVSLRSLLRRLGVRKFRAQPTPEVVIDWATIQSFGVQDTVKRNLKLASRSNELRRLRPGELADLLEDLGRDERRELLNTLPTEQAADALEEMEPEEVETILRESTPEEAGTYLSKMQPDEAADALRDVGEKLRKDLLAHMTKDSAKKVGEVLSYEETAAGGFMNTTIFTAHGSETVAGLRERLQAQEIDLKEIESVVIIDDTGGLVYDLALVDLLLANLEGTLGTLIKPPEPVTVLPMASIAEVAELLTEGRQPSILVVDDNNRPLGRIFADDVLDALLPGHGRFHFPRLLS
jgi:CBS domain-containing protein/sporulation protein YlmC with PRC-barrel domain